MTLRANFYFPQGPIVGPGGFIALEWQQFLQNPQFVSLTNTVIQERQGADVVAANSITLGADGNYFNITGNTQIKLLNGYGWLPGARVTFKFTGTPTVKQNQTASTTYLPFLLNGSADFVTTAGSTLSLVLDSSGVWVETARMTA